MIALGLYPLFLLQRQTRSARGRSQPNHGQLVPHGTSGGSEPAPYEVAPVA